MSIHKLLNSFELCMYEPNDDWSFSLFVWDLHDFESREEGIMLLGEAYLNMEFDYASGVGLSYIDLPEELEDKYFATYCNDEEVALLAQYTIQWQI